MNYCMNCLKKMTGEGKCPHCGFDNSIYESESHYLRPNTILCGKYLIGRVLGEGGFGITYVGLDLNLELKVAIKEYYPNGYVTRMDGSGGQVTMMSDKRTEIFRKGQEQFIEEARCLAKFWGLPGIVAVKDFFQENGTAYIVMEFAEGQNLKQVLEQCGGRIGTESFMKLMCQVMRSLQTVHEAGIIHRDISPDNLIIDQKGNLKLLDFGAARKYIAENEKSLSVILKPGYAPEEQYRSHGSQGPWTDVYALCATIYRAITGRVPVESLDRMAGQELPLPSQLGVVISKQQEQALMKGLALKAGDRCQSMKELEEALFAECVEPEAENAQLAEERTQPVEEVTQPNVELDGRMSLFEDSQNAEKKEVSCEESIDNKKTKKKKYGKLIGCGIAAIGLLFVILFRLWAGKEHTVSVKHYNMEGELLGEEEIGSFSGYSFLEKAIGYYNDRRSKYEGEPKRSIFSIVSMYIDHFCQINVIETQYGEPQVIEVVSGIGRINEKLCLPGYRYEIEYEDDEISWPKIEGLFVGTEYATYYLDGQ